MVSSLPSIVEDTHGRVYNLRSDLGKQGGQGIMFPFDKLALKILYAPDDGSGVRKISTDSKQYAIYQRSLIHLMAMPKIQHLSLPIVALKAPYCGYVMQFMTGLMPLAEMLKLKPQSEGGYGASIKEHGGLGKRLKILKNLAGILREIHAHGLVYCDLTPSNVFVSEQDAQSETWIIDVDNLAYANEVNTCWQTPWYRAPEVYKGQRNSSEADSYSFALVAYELLTFSKPFNGAEYRALENDVGWDEEDDAWDDASPQIQESIAQRKTESGELSYVAEEQSTNNKPAGIPIQYVATSELQELFFRTFGPTGRSNPVQRPSMNEWYNAFERACSAVVRCPNAHWHLGKECIVCYLNKDALRESRYYKLSVSQVDYYADSVHGCGEDNNIDNIRAKKRLIEELVIDNHPSAQRKNLLVLSVPWRLFAYSESTHNPNSTAFVLHFNGTALTFDNCYDSNLHLKIMDDQVLPTIQAIWQNRFEYQIALEEVK